MSSVFDVTLALGQVRAEEYHSGPLQYFCSKISMNVRQGIRKYHLYFICINIRFGLSISVYKLEYYVVFLMLEVGVNWMRIVAFECTSRVIPPFGIFSSALFCFPENIA